VIIFITFVVILLTLVVQGLTLPMVINMLKLEDPDNHLPEHEENKLLHKRLAKESLLYLQTHFAKELAEHPALKHLADRWEDNEWLYENEVAHNGYKKTYKHLLNEQRKWLHEWNKEIRADEDVIRQHLMRIDLEEEKLKYS
jgi:CPA1 family monovalent cation:H+ antiporter